MKILYLTNENYFKNPIIDSQVVTLINDIHLQDSKIDFDLVTFDKDERIPSFQAIPKAYQHIFLEDKVHFLNIFNLIMFCLRNAKKYDLIHVRSFPGMFGAILAKVLFKTKVLFDPRGLYAEEFSYLENRVFLTKFFKFFEPYYCKFADAIVLVSRPFSEYYKSKYNIDPNRLKVIPTFSTEPNFYKQQDSIINIKKDYFKNENAQLFVYSGSMESWQNIEEVIIFFKLVSETIENARFAIFSKEAERFEEIFNKNFSAELFFIKALSKEEIPYYLNQADFGILFRDDHLINIVSAPIKVKDYLLSGVPIIMTANIGDSSEYVRLNKFGYVLQKLNREEMKDVVAQIKQNKNQFNKREIMDRSATDFSVKKAAFDYINIYKILKNE